MEGGHGGVRAVPGPALAREKSKFKLFTLSDKIIIEFLDKYIMNIASVNAVLGEWCLLSL